VAQMRQRRPSHHGLVVSCRPRPVSGPASGHYGKSGGGDSPRARASGGVRHRAWATTPGFAGRLSTPRRTTRRPFRKYIGVGSGRLQSFELGPGFAVAMPDGSTRSSELDELAAMVRRLRPDGRDAESRGAIHHGLPGTRALAVTCTASDADDRLPTRVLDAPAARRAPEIVRYRGWYARFGLHRQTQRRKSGFIAGNELP